MTDHPKPRRTPSTTQGDNEATTPHTTPIPSPPQPAPRPRSHPRTPPTQSPLNTNTTAPGPVMCNALMSNAAIPPRTDNTAISVQVFADNAPSTAPHTSDTMSPTPGQGASRTAPDTDRPDRTQTPTHRAQRTPRARIPEQPTHDEHRPRRRTHPQRHPERRLAQVDPQRIGQRRGMRECADRETPGPVDIHSPIFPTQRRRRCSATDPEPKSSGPENPKTPDQHKHSSSGNLFEELLVQRCNGDITEHEGHEMTQQATPHRTSGKSTLAGDLIVFGTVIAPRRHHPHLRHRHRRRPGVVIYWNPGAT